VTDATRAQLVTTIRSAEGPGPMRGGRHLPYPDSVGVLTIGYGRALGRIGISEDEAEWLLAHDVERSLSDLDFACAWWRTLPDPWQAGLAELCFQLGLDGLLGFRKMLDAIRRGDGVTAGAELLASRYAGQVPARAQRLAAVFAGGVA
jgi:lysozyme